MNALLWEIFEPLVSALRPQKAPERPKPAVQAAQGKPRPARVQPAPELTPLLPFQELKPQRRAAHARAKPPAPRPPKPAASSTTPSMQARYDAVVSHMLETHQVRVRKWRTSMSGIAWYVTYRDGRIQRLIESPRPKGPMSIAVFLHEIGHHAIGFNVYKPRCLEEYHAWRWALEAMQEHGLNITDQVKLRVHRSLHYAVQKAQRRGIKRIPDELAPYLEKPTFKRRRQA